MVAIVTFLLVLGFFGALAALRWSWRVSAPDEWLLQVRDGKLVRAGVGISVLRLPGDVLARFSSTLQRVTFAASGASRDQVPIAVDGFLLWSVDPDGDGPFRAFRALGIADLERPPAGLKSRKHLLTGPQHHAFQGLVAAEVAQLVSTRSFAELLHDRPALLEALRARLDALGAKLAIRVTQVEIHAVRPADATLGADLGAREEQAHREAAARARLESEARLAAEREASTRELAEARRLREEEELAARLDRMRREAEAARDAALLALEAEERKSQAVRDAELAKLSAEKVAEAFGRLPLKEARWVSVGDSPAQSIAALVAGVRELLH